MTSTLSKGADALLGEVRLSRELDLLYNFAGILGSNPDVKTLFDDALGPLLTMARADKILIGLLASSEGKKAEIIHRGWQNVPRVELKSQAVAALGTDATGFRDKSLLPASVAGGLELTEDGSIALVPMYAYGRHLGLLVILRDPGKPFSHSTLKLLNTASRQLALAVENARLFEDLQKSYRKLMEAQEDLIRSERLAALGGMSATMAHEIRNPLATIFSSLSQIRKHAQIEGDAATLLEIAEEEALRLNRMVAGLLEFARPRMPRFEESHVTETIREEIAAASKKADWPAGVEVEFEPDNDQMVALVDPEQFQRAVHHVISNAGAVVQPGSGQIQVRVSRPDGLPNGLILEVEDNGCGIPSEQKASVFDPFFSSKPSGTGLGLSVVKRIAEDHRGVVEIHSELGTGTTVRVLFTGKSREE